MRTKNSVFGRYNLLCLNFGFMWWRYFDFMPFKFKFKPIFIAFITGEPSIITSMWKIKYMFAQKNAYINAHIYERTKACVYLQPYVHVYTYNVPTCIHTIHTPTHIYYIYIYIYTCMIQWDLFKTVIDICVFVLSLVVFKRANIVSWGKSHWNFAFEFSGLDLSLHRFNYPYMYNRVAIMIESCSWAWINV